MVRPKTLDMVKYKTDFMAQVRELEIYVQGLKG